MSGSHHGGPGGAGTGSKPPLGLASNLGGGLGSATLPGDPIALLDIGTAKITCMVVEPFLAGNDGLQLRLRGIGSQRSQGIKAGVVVDPEAAEPLVRGAIAQAERMAGTSVARVHLALACGRLKSLRFRANASVEGASVGEVDRERLLQAAVAYAERDGRVLAHLNAVDYWLDGMRIGPRLPARLAGRQLSVDLHGVTADDAPLRNLIGLVERCYLDVAGLYPSGYASGLAVTTAEERRHGVVTVDIGAGTTTLAAFQAGTLRWSDAMPIGGAHLTSDISRQLATTLAESERIKALYGTLVQAQSDEHETFTYPLEDEEGPRLYQNSKAQLRGIIVPRVDTQLRLIASRLAASAAEFEPGLTGWPVVITGGGAQLVGLGAAAAELLGRPVRVARPRPLVGLLDRVCSHGFATVIGLGLAALAGGTRPQSASRPVAGGRGGYLGRVERWVRESF